MSNKESSQWKIKFYNNINEGIYEYSTNDSELYKLIRKIIKEDVEYFYMGNKPLVYNIQFCKFNDGETIDVTNKLIRLNDSLKIEIQSFSLDDYIDKYSNNELENEIIKTEIKKKKRYENGEKALTKGINYILIGYFLSKIIFFLKSNK